MTLVLDAGALIAIDRGERTIARRLKAELAGRREPRTHAGVVAQVWRHGSRQARLASALAGIRIETLDDEWARRCGVLLGAAGRGDVVDAGVAMLALDGDEVFTSDVGDIEALIMVTGQHVDIVAV